MIIRRDVVLLMGIDVEGQKCEEGNATLCAITRLRASTTQLEEALDPQLRIWEWYLLFTLLDYREVGDSVYLSRCGDIAPKYHRKCSTANPKFTNRSGLFS